MNVKIMVTGGCGFIGSHIVEQLLKKQYEVIVVDNLSTGKLNNIILDKIDFYLCDISSKEFQQIVQKTRPDYIIHQAAHVSVVNSTIDMMHDAEINIKGSLNVIEAAKRNKVKKIIFASSAAVYGETQYLPIDIHHQTNPQSPYGLSKCTVEEYLKFASQYYGVKSTILRYSNVYGPRQNHLGEGGVVSIFANNMTNHKDIIIYGDGEQTRDFIYVKDVATANIQALHYGDGRIFNVSSSAQVTINDLFNKMTNLLNNNQAPIYQKAREGEIIDSLLCNDITKKYLNWDLLHSLDNGLKETIDFYKNYSLVN
ncbi:NAD-dependent epimerase/dehydratase family protein [Chengkuizengella axinellae]|uniref:NAD-dependent epimerase/dehydratase family protein n=1 Tax=Chengkuizengella axinellae TaxID=3064388 RepID=A0ABT9IZT8_9BACL|nr:NAD-dependent epimerase/dehydratase family protein [Chengkuizengella sp. 2205SS18-9]MDP5274723.1 NAD-dependent epimerase/dehydratase family protein [Chengkuizengella sp. 2205SS18-9]